MTPDELVRRLLIAYATVQPETWSRLCRLSDRGHSVSLSLQATVWVDVAGNWLVSLALDAVFPLAAPEAASVIPAL